MAFRKVEELIWAKGAGVRAISVSSFQGLGGRCPQSLWGFQSLGLEQSTVGLLIRKAEGKPWARKRGEGRPQDGAEIVPAAFLKSFYSLGWLPGLPGLSEAREGRPQVAMETCFRFPAGPCQSPYFLEKGFVWGWPQAGKLGLMMGGLVLPGRWCLKSLS